MSYQSFEKKQKIKSHQCFQEYGGKREADKYKRCAEAGQARMHHNRHTGTSKGMMQGKQRKMTRSLHKKLRGTTQGQKQLQQLIGRGGTRQGLECCCEGSQSAV